MRNRFLILAALVPFAAASSQEAGPARSNVLSIQPINAMLTAYSAEYEHKTGGAVTLGVGGTYFDAGDGVDEVKYKSGDVKLRYYPEGTALRGFSFGVSGGDSSILGQDVYRHNASMSGPRVGVR